MIAFPMLSRLAALAALILALLPAASAAPQTAPYPAPAATAPVAEQVGSLGGRFTAVAVAGGRAYVGEGDALAIFDIGDPANITRLARLPLGITVASIEVAGGIAYVAGGGYYTDNGSLKLVDVRDPARPLLRGSAPTPGYAQRVVVAGDYAYVASDSGQGVGAPGYFLSFDVRAPDHPALRGSYGGACQTANSCSATNTLPRAMSIVGSRAYVAGDGLVQLFDVQNPAALRLLGSLPTTDIPTGVFVSGANVYVAGNNGLTIIDISRSDQPRVRSNTLLAATAVRVEVHGTLAYLTLGDGLQIVDVSNPDKPAPVATYIRRLDGLGADSALAGDRFVLVGIDLEIIAIRPGPTLEVAGFLPGQGSPAHLSTKRWYCLHSRQPGGLPAGRCARPRRANSEGHRAHHWLHQRCGRERRQRIRVERRRAAYIRRARPDAPRPPIAL